MTDSNDVQEQPFLPFFFHVDDKWYAERITHARYSATSSGAVVTLLLFTREKLPKEALLVYQHELALCVLLLGLAALFSFLASLFMFRGKFYYQNYRSIVADFTSRGWGIYRHFARVRLPVEVVCLYLSWVLATLAFFTGMILTTHLLVVCLWT